MLMHEKTCVIPILTTIFLCLNQTLTISAPSKILHSFARTLGVGVWVFFVTKFSFKEGQSFAGYSPKYMKI